MPLPAALAAKLAQRGILSKKQNNQNRADDKGDEEEIFAEDYDDSSQHNRGGVTYSPTYHSDEENESVQDQINLKFKGHPGCPNKSNIYHECTKYCKTKWRDGIKVPARSYLKKKIKLLNKYPLPENWKEVYDPGYGRYYYWDMDTDNVSWLPPNHPKAVISECAAVMKEETHLAEGDSSSDDSSDEEGEDEEEETAREEDNKQKQLIRKEREEEKKKRKEAIVKTKSKGRAVKRENDLDPMDPASYSDIPRGGWSDGLASQNEAKTGADTTASGPLFQMRPYPSPGDILRANKKKKMSSPDNSP